MQRGSQMSEPRGKRPKAKRPRAPNQVATREDVPTPDDLAAIRALMDECGNHFSGQSVMTQGAAIELHYILDALREFMNSGGARPSSAASS